MSETILYDYWRSTASYRVRIALNLANIPYQSVSVDLVAGDHRKPEHLILNPQGLVPVLEIDGERFTQSLAIIDYLDATRNLGLLPQNPILRTKVQALAQAIAVDLHPVCNLGVVKHATNGEEPARTEWMQHFITPGLKAFDTLLKDFEQIPFCTGSTPSLADICLIPQLYNAQRWGADYAGCSRIIQAADACAEHPAFIAAHPDAVANAVKS
ncbi:maleylacetoacetate isomerase [Granulosicoccus antarcticus]|uniref:Maleylpyruvate isomerase n=1 Tax=Granulosicoccus antarcticus IMCC3135 TaxID=1192854 RepID=A0A2Z2NWS6_9GAMM|nr:maleylacetoacetate isomerase [Granulosicoccus antarcticus]ASJ74198.1 Maleylpyruvate isomerase [Granulosicoccus antarcticus IMCC3135]